MTQKMKGAATEGHAAGGVDGGAQGGGHPPLPQDGGVPLLWSGREGGAGQV